eukprot:scaffold49223_cov104-Cyclotella_meneghiniana.AAC.1
MFKKKQMKVEARKDGETDKETTNTVIELSGTAVEAVITELEDKRKATFKYLDISGSEYCFSNCTEVKKAALMGVTATNDEAESALGSVTGNIQCYGRSNLFAAAAVASAKRTKVFQRKDAKGKRSLGIFHQFDKQVQEAIVSVAMQDAPQTLAREIMPIWKSKQRHESRMETCFESLVLKRPPKNTLMLCTITECIVLMRVGRVN